MTQSFPMPTGYRIVTGVDLITILRDRPPLAAVLGGAPALWQASEISDGNMNAVWRVAGPDGSLIAKQALPYIRVIGESWPFPVSRIAFEYRALCTQARHVADFLPQVHDYLPDLGLLIMQDLSAHIVLRSGLTAGAVYPAMPGHLAQYLARSLFFTSDLAMTTGQKNRLADQFSGNAHLCETTQDVIFTGPYWAAPLNRLTPGQEPLAARLRDDAALKLAAAEMNHAFRTQAEALLHGDLHTGSVMVTATDTRVIDPEWAFVGPMGFDIGAVIGNLLLNYFSQSGHATAQADRDGPQSAVLAAACAVWSGFAAELRALWAAQPGPIRHDGVMDDAIARAFIDRRLATIFADTLGFAGAKMIRRIIGISHVGDLETIADPVRRAACEARALTMARHLLCHRSGLQDIGQLADLARDCLAAP